MRAISTITLATFAETIRQPVFGIMLAMAGIFIALSPAMAMYTFIDSTKLVQDMGLATILMTGLLLSVFSSSAAISQEIDDKTALTVLSKPVGRGAFLIGKFLGVAFGITLACYVLTIILMLVFRFGVKDTASTELDWGSLVGILAAVAVALVVGGYLNYFTGRPFMTIAVKAVAVTLSICLLVFCLYNKEYKIAGFGSGLNWNIAIAALLILEASLILTVIAVAAGTHWQAVASLAATAIVFFSGMVSEFFLSSLVNKHLWAKAIYWLLPNLQLYWVTEGMTIGQNTPQSGPAESYIISIPFEYVGWVSLYSFFYISAILCLAMMLFSKREVT